MDHSLSASSRSYERGFHLRNDYYNGINLAYLLNVRSANTNAYAETIADFVQAQRVRREVIEICQELLKLESLSLDAKYWVQATRAEAYFGLDDEVHGQQIIKEALSMPVAQWMKDSTLEQLDKLRPMLTDSPLRHIKVDAT